MENETQNGISEQVCFFVTPMGEEGSDKRKRSEMVYQILKRALDPFGYKPLHPGQIAEPGIITHGIIKLLIDAPLVVADLTGANPNVYYELAIRHAVGKPFIQLIEKGEKVPFDVAGIRTIKIEITDPYEAEEKIKASVKAIHKPEYNVTTPISTAINQLTILEIGGRANGPS